MTDRPSSTAGSGVVAAFDFDATLTEHDSVMPFLRRFVTAGGLVGGFAGRPVRTLQALVGRDRSALRAVASDVVFAGRAASEVAARAEEFAGDLVATALRGDTTARLGWHLAQGHEVVIVSASYAEYLHLVARHLGVDAVLSTRLEVVDGACTGRLDGANCRGPEKVRRLERWLSDAGRCRTDVVVWAYGDSTGDREMLAWADHGVWVRRPLASVAATP